MTKRESGIYALSVWVNASRPFIGALIVSDFVRRIDADSPTWLENFGGAYQAATDSTRAGLVNEALEDLAAKTKGVVSVYPDGGWRGQEFFDALYGRTIKIDLAQGLDIAKDVGKGVVKDVSSVFTFGALGLLGAAGVSLGIYLYLRGKK